MIFFLESSKTAFSNVDPPPLRSETEAHVERYGLGSQLQHSRKGGRILRGFHSIIGQILRRELKGPGTLEWRHLSVPRHSDGLGIAERGVGRRELRRILHRGPDIRDQLKALASIQEAFHDASFDFFRYQRIGDAELNRSEERRVGKECRSRGWQ